jgi:hypothetical protein
MIMSNTFAGSPWATVVAALGASGLTTLGLLSRDVVAARRRKRADRLTAYEVLLGRSVAVVQAAATLRMTMMFRSGLQEGVEVALRHRMPLDPFDLSDRLSDVFQPLFVAQAKVWASGSREVIPLANNLVSTCLNLLGVSTEGGRADGKLKRYVFGESWTPEQDEAYWASVKAVADARRKIAEFLRREGKQDFVDVFAEWQAPNAI